MKSEGFLVMKTCLVNFWFMTPCSFVAGYQHFGSSMLHQNVGNHIPACERSTQKMHNLGWGGGSTFKYRICITENNVFLAKWCNHRVYCIGHLLLKCHCHVWAYACTFPVFVPVCVSLCM
jgi:hypothetical protein